MQELRYALRTLSSSPGFTAVAVLTLALGIGANTAIFSLIQGVLLRPLPYLDEDNLVVLRQSAPKAEIANLPFSVQEVYDYREQAASLEAMVEYHTMTFTLLGRGEPERVVTGVVSAELFDLLGVDPLLGRTFEAADDKLDAEAVLVLSHSYWQRAFGSDPDIVGQVFEMNNRPHTVVGVLPPIPQYPNENDVYMSVSACPFRANGETARHQNRSAFRALTVTGRLAEGKTLDDLQRELKGIGERFEVDFPDTYHPDRGYQVSAVPLKEVLTQQARPTLLILLGTTGLVLLIACANVANLTVARMLRRQREMAVRASLGASRGRLLAQTLLESGLLSLAGGAVGLGFAYGGLDMLVRFTSRFTTRAESITIDGWVLLFTLIVSLATGVVFGAMSALPTRRDLSSALRDGSQAATAGRSKQWLRGALVTAQVAVSVVLLVAAGLMLRSFSKLQQVHSGFNPERVLTAQLSLNWTKYTTAQATTTFFDELLTRVRSHPGVVSAAASSDLPFERQGPRNRSFSIEDRPIDDGGLAPSIDFRIASPDYFRTLGIPLVRGRTFEASDDAQALPVAVVTRSLARNYWGDDDPISRRVSVDGGNTWLTIVGVVGDVREYGPAVAATDELYVPLAQGGFAQRLLVRTASEPMAMARGIKDLVWAVDPDQPVSNLETMESKTSAATASPRLTTLLLGMFAGLALVITAAGLSGVVAFVVSQRTQEIGIRMALGARRSTVLLMVLRQGLRWVVIGLVVGLAASLAVSRLMTDLLFEVGPSDPLTLLSVSLVLIAAATAACLLPARRAIRVQPTVALRSE
ncbi:MAG: ABC transporter permease [Acidobacteriota bacterium]